VFGFVGTLSMALFPVFPTLGVGIALQMFGGLAESINWIGVQALVARSLEGLPTYTGRMTFVARIGGFAGPPLIGAAWDLFGGPGAFAALALWVACGWAAAWMVPETGTAAPAREQAARRIRLADLVPSAADYAATFRLLAIGAVALVIAATVVRQAGSAMQSSFYVVWLEGIGISGTAIGALLGLSAALAAVSSLAVGPLTRRIGAHWLLLAMVFVSIVSMAITPLLGTYALLMAAIAVRGLSQGLNLPLLISIMARAVRADDQAKAVALRITVNRANSALVPVLMGAAAEVVGLENSFYAVGGAGLALLALLALWVWRAPAFRGGPG